MPAGRWARPWHVSVCSCDRLATAPWQSTSVPGKQPLPGDSGHPGSARGDALLAKAHGDESGYRDYRDRYRAMATSLGFERHMAWAEAMP